MNAPPLANILVIDNDEGLQRALATRLRAIGYRCLTACNGAQGLSELSLGDVDLVITDLNMPAMDGLEVIRRVRQQYRVPVIVVTGFPGDYHASLIHYPDVAVLTKPFSTHQLIDLVIAELAMHPRQRSA